MKSTVYFLLIISLVFLGRISHAQSTTQEWGNRINTGWHEYYETSVVDQKGNIYSFFTFKDTVHVQTMNGGKTFTTEQRSFLLQKIDSKGKTIWAKQLSDQPLSIFYTASIDKQGNIYYCGGEQINELTFQTYIEKRDASGEVLWKKNLFQPFITNQMNNLGIRSILVDSDHSVILTGSFRDTLILDETNFETALITENRSDLYTVKLNKNQEFVWANTITGSGHETSSGHCLDHLNNIYIAGTFDREIQVGSDEYNTNGNTDIFIQKISADGTVLSFTQLGGKYADRPKEIIVDHAQNIYLTGNYYDTLDFDPGPAKQMRRSNGTSDAFLLKLDQERNYQWVKTIGTSGGRSKGQGINIIDKKIYWSGVFDGDIDFDPSNIVLKLSSAATRPGQSRYPVKYIQINNADGEFINALALNESNSDEINQLIVLDDQRFIVGGKKIAKDQSKRGYQLYIDKRRFSDDSKTQTITACSSYYWSATGLTYTKSGHYSGRTNNGKGKPKKVEIDLTIYEMNTSVEQYGFNVSAEEVNASYQWLECTNGCQPVLGAIGERFTATKSGKYCVELTSTMCNTVDTSRQMTIKIVEIEKELLERYYNLNMNILIDDFHREHIPLDGDVVKIIPFRKSELYGFVENGNPEKWIVEPQFEQVFAVYETGAIVKDTAGGYGFIDNTGNYLIPPYFQNLLLENGLLHGMVSFVSDTSLHLPPNYDDFNLHMYFDQSGKQLFQEYSHDYDGFRNEELAWFRFGTELHIRDRSGALIDSFDVRNKPEFLGIADSKLLFQVRKDNGRSVVAYDLNDNVVFDLPGRGSSKIYQITPNMYGILTSDYNYYFCDSLGENLPFSSESGVIGFSDSDPAFFKEDYFVVGNRDIQRMGVIDRSGKTIVPFEYQRISPLINGFWTCFKDNMLASFINEKGEVVLEDKFPTRFRTSNMDKFMFATHKAFYDDLSFSWEQLLTVDTLANGEVRRTISDSSYYFYYDISGEIMLILPPSILASGNFSEGLAPALDTSKMFGFINKKGEWVVKPSYDVSVAGSYPIPYFVVPKFTGGYVYIKSYKGYVDKTGREYFSGKRMEDHYDFSH